MVNGSLVVIALCIGGGLLLVLGIVGIVVKVRSAFRNSLLGQIYNGVKNEVKEGKVGPEDFSMKQEFSTPKSVSDLSTALIPRINKDFPDLSLSQMQSAAQESQDDEAVRAKENFCEGVISAIPDGSLQVSVKVLEEKED